MWSKNVITQTLQSLYYFISTLAVAHEKGKLTVLQLSALLKQADSSQKKLTLTRLASAPVPFTVLSIGMYATVTETYVIHILCQSPQKCFLFIFLIYSNFESIKESFIYKFELIFQ